MRKDAAVLRRSFISNLFILIIIFAFGGYQNVEALSLRAGASSGAVEADPLLQTQGEEECAEPSEDDLKEAKEKFQKWTDKNAPDAKTTGDVADKIMAKYDTSPQGGDGKLSRDEIKDLLKDADIGTWLTRGCWADGLLEKFDTPLSDPPNPEHDGKISKAELKAALDEMKIKPPAS